MSVMIPMRYLSADLGAFDKNYDASKDPTLKTGFRETAPITDSFNISDPRRDEEYRAYIASIHDNQSINVSIKEEADRLYEGETAFTRKWRDLVDEPDQCTYAAKQNFGSIDMRGSVSLPTPPGREKAAILPAKDSSASIPWLGQHAVRTRAEVGIARQLFLNKRDERPWATQDMGEGKNVIAPTATRHVLEDAQKRLSRVIDETTLDSMEELPKGASRISTKQEFRSQLVSSKGPNRSVGMVMAYTPAGYISGYNTVRTSRKQFSEKQGTSRGGPLGREQVMLPAIQKGPVGFSRNDIHPNDANPRDMQVRARPDGELMYMDVAQGATTPYTAVAWAPQHAPEFIGTAEGTEVSDSAYGAGVAVTALGGRVGYGKRNSITTGKTMQNLDVIPSFFELYTGPPVILAHNPHVAAHGNITEHGDHLGYRMRNKLGEIPNTPSNYAVRKSIGVFLPSKLAQQGDTKVSRKNLPVPVSCYTRSLLSNVAPVTSLECDMSKKAGALKGDTSQSRVGNVYDKSGAPFVGQQMMEVQENEANASKSRCVVQLSTVHERNAGVKIPDQRDLLRAAVMRRLGTETEKETKDDQNVLHAIRAPVKTVPVGIIKLVSRDVGEPDKPKKNVDWMDSNRPLRGKKQI